MTNTVETGNDLKRLQSALEAVSADLDAIERRPHFCLRHAADELLKTGPRGIETFVDQFALAAKRAASKRAAA
jgi:hypothetical protein